MLKVDLLNFKTLNTLFSFSNVSGKVSQKGIKKRKSAYKHRSTF